MDDTEMLSCWEAIEAVRDKYETDIAAFSRIVRRCESGLITCVASHWSHNETDGRVDVTVPSRVWKQEHIYHQLDFRRGDLRVPSSPFQHRIGGGRMPATVIGIKFDRAGIEAMVIPDNPQPATAVAAETPEPVQSNAGRHRSDKWLHWVAVACRMASDNEITDTMTGSKIMNAIDERLAFLGLPKMGDTATRPQAVRILEVLKISDEDFYSKGE